MQKEQAKAEERLQKEQAKAEERLQIERKAHKDEMEKRKSYAFDFAKKAAKEKADRCSKAVSIAVYMVFALSAMISVLGILIGGINDSHWISIGFGFLTIVQGLDFSFHFLDYRRKLSNKCRDRVYAKVYDDELKKIESALGMKIRI